MPMPCSPWQKRAKWWCALLILPFCWACSGGSLNEVKGSVKQNGSPVEGAVVIFHLKGGDAKSQVPTGSTGADGTFTLSTGTKPGAPAGDYAVTVTVPEAAGKGEGKSKKITTEFGVIPETTDRFKGRYANPKSSPLSATIKSGKNELEPFELQ